MSFGFAQPWHLFLPREGGHLVAIGGCGGREDFLSAMVAVYRDEGVAVAVATIGAGGASAPRGPTVAWSDLVAGKPMVPAGVVHVHGGDEAEAGQVADITAEQADELGRLLPDHVVLVTVGPEAGRPLADPAVVAGSWPARTSLALLAVGVGAVGGPAGRNIARSGAAPSGPLADLPAHAVLTWDHLAELVGGERGLGTLLPTAPRVLALAGLEDQDDSIGLFAFCDRMMAEAAWPLVVFGTRTDAGFAVRTAYRDAAAGDADGGNPDGPAGVCP
ncbi:hypothetical protein KDM41_08245 [bacterium]|nr:hypothetical protein [bacterium]